ncbi:epsin-3 [Tachyglossus aculeatus]|uniref:epsin-3 n=1 Tax=Tachyglossus aculeatus TaxID=9261 RepID=UPI0018F5F1D5|nr:epsin-3 [Tachyglossus aculeatus]
MTTTSALRRQVKNLVHNYSEAEIKVREATSNDPWGPPSSLMSEIADLTFNTVAFAEVMGMIWRRLNDSGKNWRHVYKALTLLDYLLKTGSDKVAHQSRENLFTIQTLKDFQYVDRDGKDQGVNVREKVRQVVGLLKDEERLKRERTHALKTKERLALEGAAIGSSQLGTGRRPSRYGDEFGRLRGSPSSYNSTSSSPRLTSDLEQARPQTTGEEELQLQLALAMSREEAEKPVPPASSRDEDLQLQLALRLSQREHEKEVRAWQDEDSPFPNGASRGCRDQEEEEEEEEELKINQSSILDLVDVFGPPPAPPSTHTSADPWDIPGFKATLEPSGCSWGPTTDPWAPASARGPLNHMALSGSQTSGEPWGLAPALSSSEPWSRPCVLPSDPWAKASPLHKPSSTRADLWGPAMDPSSPPGGTDLFTKLPDLTELGERPESTGRPGSPVDLDLFGDLVPGPKQNGREEPGAFDVAGLASALAQPGSGPQSGRTPESFLGSSASSLVNLDSLVVALQTPKTRNPFLSGPSMPAPTNPFSLGEPGRPTLNQLRTGSPGPSLAPGDPAGSMTYSTSLPLPLSSVPLQGALPASTGVFPSLVQALPQPLLPTAGPGAPPPPAPQTGLNPFL